MKLKTQKFRHLKTEFREVEDEQSENGQPEKCEVNDKQEK